jgi:hypothetical protein
MSLAGDCTLVRFGFRRSLPETDYAGIKFGIAVQDQVAIRACLGKLFAWMTHKTWPNTKYAYDR